MKEVRNVNYLEFKNAHCDLLINYLHNCGIKVNMLNYTYANDEFNS